MRERSPSANGAQGRVPSRCPYSTDAPSPCAYAAQLHPVLAEMWPRTSAVAMQMWEGRAQSACRCGIVERSPNATGPSPVHAEMWQGRAQAVTAQYCRGAGRVPGQMSQALSAGYLLVVSSTWIGDAVVSSEMVLELTVVPAGNRNRIVAGVIGAVGHVGHRPASPGYRACRSLRTHTLRTTGIAEGSVSPSSQGFLSLDHCRPFAGHCSLPRPDGPHGSQEQGQGKSVR